MHNDNHYSTIPINTLEEFELIAQCLRENFGPIEITFSAPCIAKQFYDSMLWKKEKLHARD